MKSKKITKILCAGGLALMLCAGTLCGVMICPMNSAQASVSSKKETALTPQEQLLAGTLELDPKNDPVIYTTDYGLEIKFHQDALYAGDVQTVALKGYIYVSAGTYNGAVLNWVIIGRNPNIMTSSFCYLQTFTSWQNCGLNSEYSGIDTTPAGTAVQKDINDKALFFDYLVFNNAVSNDEIPENCVLCISEKNIGTSSYHSSTAAIWANSSLRTKMDALYQSEIEDFDIMRNKIQAMDLQTYYLNSSSKVTSCLSTDYFFSLADNSHWNSYTQEYCIETYLSQAGSRVSYNHNSTTANFWWSRSGSPWNVGAVWSVNESGTYAERSGSYYSYGVRPAFVLQI